MLSYDPSFDYLTMDDLVSVTYYSSTGDNVFQSPAQTIDNCLFFGEFKINVLLTMDIKKADSSLVVSAHEWPGAFTAVAPQRGDEFTVTTVDGAKTYTVIQVDLDWVLKAWTLYAYVN